MFEKNLRMSYLLDFYGDALDEHTASIMKAYYNDDLSLAEIAADEGISRQGIRHLIKKGEEQLEFLEDKLGLTKRHEELSLVCESLCEVKAALSCRDGCEDAARKIERAIGIIMKGNQDVRESY